MRKVFRLFPGVLLLLALALKGTAFGGEQQEKTPFDDRMIGSSVKLMAKAYILTADIEKLKKHHAARIRGMDDDSFRVQYANTLGVIEESPGLRERFGLGAYMDREAMVATVEGLNKDKLYKMIDAVPDKVISSRFKRFMARRGDQMRGMDVPARVQYAWRSLVGRIEKK